VQAVGSLFALEESILSSQVEGESRKFLLTSGYGEGESTDYAGPQELQFESTPTRAGASGAAAAWCGGRTIRRRRIEENPSVQRAEADLFDADISTIARSKCSRTT